MRKIFILLTALLITCPNSYAMPKFSGFGIKCNNSQNFCIQSCAADEIKKAMLSHVKYANSYDYNGLKSLYSDGYTNSDGLNKDIYFSLIKKTWDSYPDVRYKIDIKSIDVSGENAVVQVSENASATTDTSSNIVKERGLLKSISTSVYYFEKIDGKWLITSDNILAEKTYLLYGSAKDISAEFNAPQQIAANSSYSASLNIIPPKNGIIIASIGKENITFPQVVAEEVFRKVPENGELERIFTSNDKNINEYAVASYGITNAEIKNGTEIKVYVTGLGFVMSRVNVIPKNEFVKVADNEKSE